MRVFAVALNGVIARYHEAFLNYLRDEYTDVDLDPDEYPWDQFELSDDEFVKHIDEFDSSAIRMNNLECNVEVAETMYQWTKGGMVPSIFCARQPEARMVTEMWLAKFGVPYSNLLFDTECNEFALCHHIDAAFYIEVIAETALELAISGQKTYLLGTELNQWDLDDLHESGFSHNNLVIVESMDQIAELEGIRG